MELQKSKACPNICLFMHWQIRYLVSRKKFKFSRLDASQNWCWFLVAMVSKFSVAFTIDRFYTLWLKRKVDKKRMYISFILRNVVLHESSIILYLAIRLWNAWSLPRLPLKTRLIAMCIIFSHTDLNDLSSWAFFRSFFT